MWLTQHWLKGWSRDSVSADLLAQAVPSPDRPALADRLLMAEVACSRGTAQEIPSPAAQTCE